MITWEDQILCALVCWCCAQFLVLDRRCRDGIISTIKYELSEAAFTLRGIAGMQEQDCICIVNMILSYSGGFLHSLSEFCSLIFKYGKRASWLTSQISLGENSRCGQGVLAPSQTHENNYFNMFRECSSNYLVKNLSLSSLDWKLIKSLMNIHSGEQTVASSFARFVLHCIKSGQKALFIICVSLAREAIWTNVLADHRGHGLILLIGVQNAGY